MIKHSAAVSQRKTWRAWLGTQKAQKLLTGILFSLVPLLLLIMFTYYPFMEMIHFSFLKMKWIGNREWVGLQNYADVFQRSDCFGALRISLYYMCGALIQIAIALYLATILSGNVRGGNLLKGIMFFPFLINGIAIGFIFKFFYTRGFVLDTILQTLGIRLDSIPYWLRDKSINNISVAFTTVWKYFGQNMVLFIGAIMSVDPQLYEAGKLDGANKWQQFRFITLPEIQTVFVLNLILSLTGSLSAFESSYVITNGANGTATYMVVVNNLAYVSQKVGLAAAMAVVLFALIILATVIQKIVLKWIFKNTDEDDNKSRKRQNMIMTRVKEKGMET